MAARSRRGGLAAATARGAAEGILVGVEAKPVSGPMRMATARLPRRGLLAMALAAPGGALASTLPVAWQSFRRRFLTADGRVVDTGNGGISHSEGQGWGLLFAAAAADRPAFDAILSFTRGALRRPGDSLHAWKWDPAATPRVSDPNNATDGDLYIAWGLQRGAARWNDRALAEEARGIARDILRLTLREVAGRRLLLPGAHGFEHPQTIVVNPSYAVFGALRALATLHPDPAWARLESDKLALLREARFGDHRLPPDWLELRRGGGPPAPAPQWPPRFSFDAVRVPLLLAWAGHATHPAARAAAAFWSNPGPSFVPAWVDLRDGSLAPFPASAGVIAIHRLVVALQRGERRMALPPAPAQEDYYSAALGMLVVLAATDLGLATA